MRRLLPYWGGLAGTAGGVIWAGYFLHAATTPGFDLQNILNRPSATLLLVLGIALQAMGFDSLRYVSTDTAILRASASTCALGTLVQAGALFTAVIFRVTGVWLLGILGELTITVALAVFAFASFSSTLPALIKVLAVVMVPFYFIGWALDPDLYPIGSVNGVDLSAALYGLLWVPFGLAISARNSRP